MEVQRILAKTAGRPYAEAFEADRETVYAACAEKSLTDTTVLAGWVMTWDEYFTFVMERTDVIRQTLRPLAPRLSPGLWHALHLEELAMGEITRARARVAPAGLPSMQIVSSQLTAWLEAVAELVAQRQSDLAPEVPLVEFDKPRPSPSRTPDAVPE